MNTAVATPAWLYRQTDPWLWSVGFFDPAGDWHQISDHGTQEGAAKRVHYLNGHKEAAA